MIKGITKIRNEAHIIQDTLDNWAQFCDGGIHVYDDNSTDGTTDQCRKHPAVVEVISSDFMDPDRERAEWFNRHTVLHSARRFMGPNDWVVYFDGDEHLEEFDLGVLERDGIEMVACQSFDAYVTPEDAHLSEWRYKQRKYVGPEYEMAPYFYKMCQSWDFRYPDQRNMDYGTNRLPKSSWKLTGKVRHWGKGLSVAKFEEKCKYYSEVFGPKYAEKWKARMGKAVHTESDFGGGLVTWDQIMSGEVAPLYRREQVLKG